MSDFSLLCTNLFLWKSPFMLMFEDLQDTVLLLMVRKMLPSPMSSPSFGLDSVQVLQWEAPTYDTYQTLLFPVQITGLHGYLKWCSHYGVHVCVQVCVCVLEVLEGRVKSQGHSSAVITLFFETQSLTETWGLLISLGWLSSEPQRTFCSCFPVPAFQVFAATQSFLLGYLGSSSGAQVHTLLA